MRYAISDIHGCPETFRQLLKRIDLQKEDDLFLLGDYVDRGPDSIGVIQHIWKLEKEGYKLTCLRGNHEQMFLDELARGEHSGVIPNRYHEAVARWMTTLDYYHETPGYLLVHAGFNFRHHYPLEDTHAMLWIRYWYDDMKLNPSFLGDRIIVHGHTPAKMLQINNEIKQMKRTQVTCIDTGCAQSYEGMGYLTALNLDTGEAVFERCCE
jgi:serine/threonine protein phosphatase 1